ncbi:efflux RND transporter periplasmic adaptor subunit [Hymenobacter sp. BT507]|uniref:Efflux RND transporter periplasmic adaptor subunit n=1 Tax=Hymenobacter citatus TaxID=2763506 RepID=A0ABR7MLI4_9BACT|nr:efflux RND transporter periplasmic adaptor subunit [Hymenobacter citatus]MBC6611942.1 efflux RND transporter periplasmic adaptor subunit [Hymenobacter citatus]
MKYTLLLLLFFVACRQATPEADSATVPEADPTPNPALAATAEQYYTCSMHPQIHEDEPGDCPICGMDLIKVQHQSATTTAHTIRLSAQQVRLGGIKVRKVGEQPTATAATGTGLTLTGRVVPNPENLTQVSARVPGRIERLYVRNPGETVRAGAPLFALYSEELQKAQLDFLLASAQQRELSGADNIDYAPLVAAARNRLQLWGFTAAQLRQLLRAGKPLNPVPYFSSTSGVVQEVALREGDYVQEGTPVFSLVDLSTVWVEAQLYATDAAVRAGQPVTVTFPSLPGREVAGRISFVNPELADSKVTLVRVALPNPQRAYTPGLQAVVRMAPTSPQAPTAAGALRVPMAAVLQEQAGSSLWVRLPNGSYENREVELGKQAGGQVEILSHLTAGEEVVVDGAYLLHSEYILQKGASPLARQ